MCGSSSSPAPAPAQPTMVSQVTIPEYAQPYMETLLGKSQALTSSPYQTYGGQRVAAPTGAQQEARSDVAGMEAPSQFAPATSLASAAGLQALSGSQYAPGQFFAPMSQAGQSSTGSFTGQGVAQQYMSPYIQNVLDVQKEEAIRDAQKQQLMANLGAARQGTYGGARQLLAGTERERNLGTQLANIQASGMQSAFDSAQKEYEAEQARRLQSQGMNIQYGLQSQLANQQALMNAQQLAEQSRQFGGTLGLQGAQTALQSALGLGTLGSQQQQAGIDLAKAQEAFGALSQADQQKAYDTAYQDFLNQQQYPYKQLGFMSDILRGSANLAGTGGQAVYQAPPSTTSQIGGLGLAGLGLYNLLK